MYFFVDIIPLCVIIFARNGERARMKNEIILNENHELVKQYETFISYLDVSSGTLQTYKEGLKAFFKYLIENNIQHPTRDDLRHFRDEFKDKVSINTINSYLTSIRRFFGYLELNGIYENICKDVKSVKTSRIPKKQVLTLEQTKNIYNNLTDLREKCLFSLAITTGLRGVEMSNACIEDIKTYNGELVLWVQCKGHNTKDEYVKLDENVLQDIVNYVGDRKEGNIFISTSNKNKGKGVTTKTLRLEIKNIFKRFGLDSDGFSLHSTRRTTATIAYNNGADLKEIQLLLHHRSLNTTSRYVSQTTRDNAKTEHNIAGVIFG